MRLPPTVVQLLEARILKQFGTRRHIRIYELARLATSLLGHLHIASPASATPLDPGRGGHLHR
jgi:hypothetical protein